MKQRVRVALVDWNEFAHHQMVFREQCLALLKLGCSVAALCPEPNRLARYLEASGAGESLKSGDIRCARLCVCRLSLFRPRRWKPAIRAALLRRDCMRAVRSLEKDIGRPFDLIFFSTIYDFDVGDLRRITSALDRPWSGLKLHCAPRYSEIPGGQPARSNIEMLSLLADPKLRALGTLDELRAPELEDAIRRPVVVFPDLTDGTFIPAHPRERELRDFAAGRRLTILTGQIWQSKGAGILARAALDPAASGLCFAFIGEIMWEFLSSDEKTILEVAAKRRDTVYFSPKRIEDEATYNAAFRAADVVFAAFRNFPHSSNTLTKAAVFEKPVLVSNGSLLEQRVRRYGIGEVVPEENSHAIVRAIHEITDDYPGWLAKAKPRWKDYHSCHSREGLHLAMRELLSRAGLTC